MLLLQTGPEDRETAVNFDHLAFPDLADAEIAVYSDSGSAEAWSSLGLALLRAGWPERSEQALNFAYELNPSSPRSGRARAALSYTRGDTDKAIEFLESNPDDPLSKLMLISILQNEGNIEASEELISGSDFSEAFPATVYQLLESRKSRLSGQTLPASGGLNEISSSSILVNSLIAAEHLVLNSDVSALSDSQINSIIDADLMITGGVYLRPILKILETSGDSNSSICADILCILGRHDEAVTRLLTTNPVSPDNRLRAAFLLIQMNKLNEADDELTEILRIDSLNYYGHVLKGYVLIQGANYQEAYTELRKANTLRSSAMGIALQGLAAEMAGHPDRAVEIYSPLLAQSSDSVVVINRYRYALAHPYLVPQIPVNATRDDFFRPENHSGFSGNFSISYYGNSGKYENKNLSMYTNLRYRWGLYNSHLSFSGRYSLTRWPDSSGDMKVLSASVSAYNFYSARFFQKLSVSAEESRYTTIERNLETILSGGCELKPVTVISINSYLGFGKFYEIDNNDETNINTWIIKPEITVRFDGTHISRYLPTLDIKATYTYYLDKSGSMSDVSVGFNYFASNHFSVGFGYDIDIEKQVEPDSTQINRASYFSISAYF